MKLHRYYLRSFLLTGLLAFYGKAAFSDELINSLTATNFQTISDSYDDRSNVSPQNNTTSAEYSAVVTAPDSAVLSSQMEGLIQQVSFKEGESFKEGDTLIDLDCTLQNAQLEKAKALHTYARKDYISNKKLAKLNSASELQVAASESAARQASADIDAAMHRTKLCTLKAPFDGVLVKRHVNAHEVVQAKTELLEIVNNSSLFLEFLVPSNAVSSLSSGLAFLVAIGETGKSYEATVDRVVPIIDPVSQTVKVISTLKTEDNDLWSGMSGWAQIP